MDILPTIRGTLDPLIQNETWSFDPSRGVTYKAEFKGAGRTQMQALAQNYVNSGVSVVLAYNQGGTASLSIDTGGNGGGSGDPSASTVDTWQMVSSNESRDGLSHPALINGLTAAGLNAPDVVAKMRLALSENTTETAAWATGGTLNGYPDIVKKFYRLQLKGSTDYRRGQYVLKHTTNAPNRYGVNVADFGIEQIYTTAELLTECQDSALWVYPLPSRLAYKISAIPSPTIQTDYLWGWLKDQSTETTGANNRIDITTEYTLEQWSTDYYTAY